MSVGLHLGLIKPFGVETTNYMGGAKPNYNLQSIKRFFKKNKNNGGY